MPSGGEGPPAAAAGADRRVAAGDPCLQVFNVRQEAKVLVILRGDVNIMLFITIRVSVQVIQASYETDE